MSIQDIAKTDSHYDMRRSVMEMENCWRIVNETHAELNQKINLNCCLKYVTRAYVTDSSRLRSPLASDSGKKNIVTSPKTTTHRAAYKMLRRPILLMSAISVVINIEFRHCYWIQHSKSTLDIPPPPRTYHISTTDLHSSVGLQFSSNQLEISF